MTLNSTSCCCAHIGLPFEPVSNSDRQSRSSGVSLSSQFGDEFHRGDAGQEAISCGFRRSEAGETCDRDGGRAIRLGNDEDAFLCILSADHRIFGLWVQPDCPGELGVVYPMSQYELILILDAGVDEVAEKPALDAVVGLRRIIVRSIGKAATYQTVRVVAATGRTLSRDGLVAWIHAAHVRANRTAQAPGIA